MDGYRARTVEDVVALDWNSIDIVKSVDNAHLGESADTSWLKELAYDAVRFVKVTLEEGNLTTGLAKRIGKDRADNASSYDDDVMLRLRGCRCHLCEMIDVMQWRSWPVIGERLLAGGDDWCGPARLYSEQAYWSMNAMMLYDLLIVMAVGRYAMLGRCDDGDRRLRTFGWPEDVCLRN